MAAIVTLEREHVVLLWVALAMLVSAVIFMVIVPIHTWKSRDFSDPMVASHVVGVVPVLLAIHLGMVTCIGARIFQVGFVV